MKLFKIQYLFLFVSCLMMFSCSNNDEINEETVPEYLIVEDPIRETGYDYTILNPSDDYVNFMKVNDDGFLNEMNILYDNYTLKAVVQFYDNGLVKSFGNDEFSVILSNYRNNKVDIAIISDEGIEVWSDFESDANWTQLIDTNSRVINPKLEESLWYTEGLFADMLEMAVKGYELGKYKWTDAMKYLTKIVADSFDLIVDDSILSSTLNTIDVSVTLSEVAKVVMTKNPWVALATLVLNYHDYETWVCDQVLLFMDAKDALTSKAEEGFGALLRIAINSYEEALSAEHNEGKVTFTLSTNVTYTQMGTDVKEWGVALFKGNELINKYPVSNISEKTQIINFSFDVTKKQFDLDCDDYIATPKDEWCLKAYEINNQNPNISIFGRSKMVLDLMYNQKPSLTILDLEVGETVDINEGNWDRQTLYSFKLMVTGSLFMEDCYGYYEGNWTNPGKGNSYTLYDGVWRFPNAWVKFPSKRKPESDYFYYEGIVNGKTIKSTNYLQYDFNGKNCTISLVNGTVDSRSRSISNDIPAKLSPVDMSLVRCVE